MSNLPIPKVILCTCHGLIAGSLPLDHISQFLKGIAPDLEVDFSDDLCRVQTIQSLKQRLDNSRPLVLGACSQLKPLSYLWEESRNNSGFSHSTSIVDLLTAAETIFNNKASVERLKLLLWAKINRLSEFRSIRKDNLKVHFALPHAKVTRRQFLTTALPRYQIVPCIEHSKCRSVGKCGLCIDSCPNYAISSWRGKVLIDRNKCSGCGACVTLCPFGAIYYPAFTLEELDCELKGLLLSRDIDLEPRIIALVCETCLSRVTGNKENAFTYPLNVLPLHIPCLAMASPWLMLRAFDMGAQGLVIISGKEKCQLGFEHAQWESNAEFVKGLLNCWQIKPERVKSIQFSSDDLAELENSLSCFAEEISLSTSILFKSNDPTLLSDDGLRLSELVKGMEGKAGASSSNGITAGAVPFGKLKLDSSQCTGCGLCAINCPTDSLTIGHGYGNNNFELLFQQNLCIGCSKCVDVCPEKCLQLHRILELDRIYAGAYRLFSDDMFSCRNCGEQVAPISMIIHLKEKLQNSDNMLIEQIELCNKCKNEIHNYHLGIQVEGLQAEIGTKHSCHGIDSQGEE